MSDRPVVGGNAQPVYLTNQELPPLPASEVLPVLPFELEIRRSGVIEGKSAIIYNITGRRQGTFEAAPNYTDVVDFPLTNGRIPVLAGTEALEVVSSSASDAAAGTGARTVRIAYIDADYALQSTVATLNGTTPVALGDGVRARYIWWMSSITVGSGTVAAGNIDLRTVAGSVVQERISTGKNQSLSARIMIPDGYTGYIFSFQADNGDNTVGQDVSLRAQVDRFTKQRIDALVIKENVYLGVAANIVNSLSYIAVPARAEIKVSTIASATNNGRVDAAFQLLLIAN